MPVDPILEKLYKKYPAIKNIGAITLKADTNFTRDNTGVGSIEYFSNKPNRNKVTYPNGFTYNHPKPGTHGIVYNPNDNDEQDIFLDILHGMPEDKVYRKHRDNFKKTMLKKYRDDFEYEYRDAKEQGYANDGKEQFKENWIDGKIRGLLFEGTKEDFDKHNYWDKAQEFYLKDKGINTSFTQLKDYLKTGQGYVLPEVNVTAKAQSNIKDNKAMTQDEINYYNQQYGLGGWIQENAGVIGKGMQIAGSLAQLIPGVGTAIGGGLMVGAKGMNMVDANYQKNQAQDAQNEQVQQLEAQQFQQQMQDSTGTYAQGGNITQFQGPRHEQGGIEVNPNVEVEGNETMGIGSTQDYVFSDRLKPKGSKKTYADLSKDIEKKYTGMENDRYAIESKNLELEELKQQAQAQKAEMFRQGMQKLQQQNPEMFQQMMQQQQQLGAQQVQQQQQQVQQQSLQGQGMQQQQQQQFAGGGPIDPPYNPVQGIVNSTMNIVQQSPMVGNPRNYPMQFGDESGYDGSGIPVGGGINTNIPIIPMRPGHNSELNQYGNAIPFGTPQDALKVGSDNGTHIVGGSGQTAINDTYSGAVPFGYHSGNADPVEAKRYEDYLAKQIEDFKSSPEGIAAAKESERLSANSVSFGSDDPNYAMGGTIPPDGEPKKLKKKDYDKAKANIQAKYNRLLATHIAQQMNNGNRVGNHSMGYINQDRLEEIKKAYMRSNPIDFSGIELDTTRVISPPRLGYGGKIQYALGDKINFTIPPGGNGDDDNYQSMVTTPGNEYVGVNPRIVPDRVGVANQNKFGRTEINVQSPPFNMVLQKSLIPSGVNEPKYMGDWNVQNQTQQSQVSQGIQNAPTYNATGNNNITVNADGTVTGDNGQVIQNTNQQPVNQQNINATQVRNDIANRKKGNIWNNDPIWSDDEMEVIQKVIPNYNAKTLNRWDDANYIKSIPNTFFTKENFPKYKQFMKELTGEEYTQTYEDNINKVINKASNDKVQNGKIRPGYGETDLSSLKTYGLFEQWLQQGNPPQNSTNPSGQQWDVGGNDEFSGGFGDEPQPQAQDIPEQGVVQQDTKPFVGDWVTAGLSTLPNIGVGIGNAILGKNLKYDRMNTAQVQPDYVDPTRAIQEVRNQYAGAKDSIRQHSRGSGNYLSNMIGATAGESSAISKIASQYDNTNAGITNQADTTNARLRQQANTINNRTSMREKQDKIGLYQNAMNSIGAGLNTGFTNYNNSKHDANMMNIAGGENYYYERTGGVGNQKPVRVTNAYGYETFQLPGQKVQYRDPTTKKVITLKEAQRRKRDWKKNNSSNAKKNKVENPDITLNNAWDFMTK